MTDKVAGMVANMEVDKVADMVAANKRNNIDINFNMEIQFGERVGQGGWSIGPKLFCLEVLIPGLVIF